MPAKLYAVLLALSLPACAAHEGPATGDRPPPPPEPRAEIRASIASVQLIQDCPDPPGEAALSNAPAGPYTPPPPAAAAAPMPAMEERAASADIPQPGSPAAARMRPDSNWSPPCTQSTMQIFLPNTGEAAGQVRVLSVRLVDATTKRDLGAIVPRKPHQWQPQGAYQPWNEQVAAKTNVNATYRLAEPDWSQATVTLGGPTDLYSRPFLLEVQVSVDGVAQTIRSPEFVRQQVHIVVT